MVALGRVRHRTPRQKRPSEKGNFTAVLLQHPQVHVEGHGVLPAEAVGLLDGPQLFRRPDAKASLGSQGLGRAVKGEAKGLPEELGQQLSQFPALRDNPNGVSGKGIAIQENAKALCQSAAPLGRKSPAKFAFYLA